MYTDTGHAQCPKCGMWKSINDMCGCESNYQIYKPTPYENKDGCYPISVADLMKHDKRVSNLEDRIQILEEALEESEAELAYKEAQLELALNIAHKAHDLRVELDRARPYKDQPFLPFGDMPE